jgi:drug/metabolite transporter (DMT)-like permease
MKLQEFLLCAAFAVALPVGQVMFKYAAIYNEKLHGPVLVRLLTNWPLMGAFAWYGATSLVWFYTLTRVPLASAYAFSILGSGLVPVLAWLIFKEHLTWHFAVGYALMLGGFLVIMQGQA